jgi:YYY domain-containing protein
VSSQSDPATWSWWYTRYVVPDTLQEFPLYSLFKADLHGHALANGYVLFAAALAYAYYRTPVEERGRRAAILLGGLGAVAGLFGFMNTWSLPVAAGLTWLAVAAAGPHPATLLPDRYADPLVPDAERREGGPLGPRLAAEAWRVVIAAVVAAVVVAVGVAIASPFLVFGTVPTNDGIGLFPPRTDVGPFLVIYGGVLAVLVGVLLTRVGPALHEDASTVLAVGGLSVLVSLAVAALFSFPVFAITVPILLGAWWLVRTDRMGFVAVLVVAGVGLLLAMDLVYAKVWPPQQERWNTTLKVAVQAWTLLGAAAGTAGALALSDARGALAARRAAETESAPGGEASLRSDGGPLPGRAALGPARAACLVVVGVVASLPFPVLVYQGAVEQDLRPNRELTVDGMAVHETFNTQELEVIRWLDDRQGTPTIVEAPGHQTYSWTNPASTLSRAEAIVGWDHQRGYRGSVAFECRARRADAVYTGSTADMAAVLRTYEVEYVYVGSNEREAYGEEMRSFDSPAFEVAYENDAATIYEVDRSELPERERLRPCPRAE